MAQVVTYMNHCVRKYVLAHVRSPMFGHPCIYNAFNTLCAESNVCIINVVLLSTVKVSIRIRAPRNTNFTITPDTKCPVGSVKCEYTTQYMASSLS